MQKFWTLAMSFVLASCGTGEATQPEATRVEKKLEAFQISDQGTGPFITMRDIGTKPGLAHYVELTFELQGYGDNADPSKVGHIAIGVGNIYKPESNDYQAPYAEGFILGQTQAHQPPEGRCVKDGVVFNGMVVIRESYYSRSILDGLACFGPLSQNKKYKVTMEFDERQQTHYKVYDGDTLLSSFSGSWVELRQFAQIGFFIIPLPDAGKYKLHELKVGTIQR